MIELNNLGEFSVVRKPLEGFVDRASLSMGWGYICSYYMWGGSCVLKRVLSWYMKRLDRSCYMLDIKSPLQKMMCLYRTIVFWGVRFISSASVFEQHIFFLSYLDRCVSIFLPFPCLPLGGNTQDMWVYYLYQFSMLTQTPQQSPPSGAWGRWL